MYFHLDCGEIEDDYRQKAAYRLPVTHHVVTGQREMAAPKNSLAKFNVTHSKLQFQVLKIYILSEAAGVYRNPTPEQRLDQSKNEVGS